ncbi:MAG: limonene-1,2-epoxide hydrolase family protein, partial [Sphingomonadales bacterium]
MSATPLEVAKAFLKAMEPLDYDRAVTLVAPDCAYTNPPPIGTVHGPQGIRAVLETFFAPTLENEFRILREAADGPVVIL